MEINIDKPIEETAEELISYHRKFHGRPNERVYIELVIHEIEDISLSVCDKFIPRFTQHDKYVGMVTNPKYEYLLILKGYLTQKAKM